MANRSRTVDGCSAGRLERDNLRCAFVGGLNEESRMYKAESFEERDLGLRISKDADENVNASSWTEYFWADILVVKKSDDREIVITILISLQNSNRQMRTPFFSISS